MIRMTVEEASGKLRELVDAALRGEEVLITTIYEGVERTLKLVVVSNNRNKEQAQQKPQLGSAKGMILETEG